MPHVETDVLIVGGGWAGLFAALAVTDHYPQLKVAIVEKSPSIERSGGLGPGIADIGLPVYPDGSTDEDLITYFVCDKLDASEYMADPKVVRAFGENGQFMLKYLEKLGVEYETNPDGTLDLRPGKGQYAHRPYEIFFKDANTVKPRIARQVVARPQISVVPTCMVTRLLTAENRVTGAIGLGTRSGDIWTFSAKAVIMTTGPGHRLYRHRTGLYWNSWNCPYSTFDGHVAAYEAGAELTGLEFTACTIFPKDLGTPGTNPWLGSGGYIVNAKGERIMPKYDLRAENAPRHRIVWAITKEIEAGNGPIYLDLRHVPEKNIQSLYAVLHEERPSLNVYFRERNLDYRKDLIEIEISERYGHQGGCSGIVVNERCETNLHGLYAAGDAIGTAGVDTGGTPCGAAAVLGYLAGKNAGGYASATEHLPLNKEQVEAEIARINSFRRDKGQITWREMNDKIADLMQDYVGYPRTEAGLRRGLERLRALKCFVSEMRAVTPREQMRSLEVSNILQMAILTTTAALERKESRLGIEHYRLDYPHRDDANWIQFVVLKKGADGEASIERRPIEKLYWGYENLERRRQRCR